MKVGTYITFDGNCLEAMTFYKDTFGIQDFEWKATWGESPMKDQTPEEYKDRIMHCSLSLSKTFNLMGCDRLPMLSSKEHNVGNNIQISIAPESRGEADRLQQDLSKDGGSISMPMKDEFWGSYFGTCVDKYGINWMIDCPQNNPNPETKLDSAALCETSTDDVLNTTEQEAETQAEENPAPMDADAEGAEPVAKKAKTDQEDDKEGVDDESLAKKVKVGQEGLDVA